jgi:iron-sulfur cluster assembly protein
VKLFELICSFAYKREQMLFITEKAKQRIDDLVIENKYSPNHFVRVSVKGGGCSGLSYNMDFDDKMEVDDQLFEDKGVKMVTDLRSFLYLVNTTLDFSEGLNGKGFHFVNPNASRTCACGESFSV